MRHRVKQLMVTLIVISFALTVFYSIPPGSFNQVPSELHSVHAVSPEVAGNFNVVFRESGLPSGETWFVNLNGTAKYNVTSNSPTGIIDTISFEEPAGSYNFSASNYSTYLSYYSPSPGSGRVNVTYNDVYVNITYALGPTPAWAFAGANANWSLSQQATSGTEFGFYSMKITNSLKHESH